MSRPRPPIPDPRPLRVLHVLASLDRGGAEAWFMDVVRTTSRGDVQINVCTLKTHVGAYDAEFERLGGRIHRCPLGRNPWSFARRFKQLVRQGGYDIVHSHVYFFSGWVLRTAARAGAPKRIAHIHRTSDITGRGLFRGLYTHWMRSMIHRHATNIVAASEAGLEAFLGCGWESDPRNRLIYNGIIPERFMHPVDRGEVRRGLEIPVDAPIVLNVGRINWHKRQYFLVDVARILFAKRKDAYFVLIGDGPDRVTVQESVRHAGLADRFRFLQVGPPEIDRYFLSADVFAFPSISEGFSVAMIEAAAAGLNVVACDVPGVREPASTAHRKTLLPLDADASAWSSALEVALDTPGLSAQQRSDHLRDFPLTSKKSVESLLRVYREAP